VKLTVPLGPDSFQDETREFVASGEATLRKKKVSLSMPSLNRLTQWLREMDVLRKAQLGPSPQTA
jgi:hypothetical protein